MLLVGKNSNDEDIVQRWAGLVHKKIFDLEEDGELETSIKLPYSALTFPPAYLYIQAVSRDEDTDFQLVLRETYLDSVIDTENSDYPLGFSSGRKIVAVKLPFQFTNMALKAINLESDPQTVDVTYSYGF